MQWKESAVELLGGAAMIGAQAPRELAVGLVAEVELEQPASQVEAARLVASAHGIYEAYIDGASVDNAVLNPGWTAYEWRLLAQESDVTELVRAAGGTAKIEVLLGNGWYRGQLGFDLMKIDYGQQTGFIGALQIAYKDGSQQLLATGADGAWKAFETRVRENSLYNGERVDARLGAGAAGVCKDAPLPLVAVDFDAATLQLQAMPPVRRQEELAPVKTWTSPAGKTLVDFGQNIVGWVRAQVQGPAGTEVALRHAEVLEDDELGVRPLRAAKATDAFVLSGGEDVFEPTLTCHGFRYVQVDGWPGEFSAESLTAVAISSDLRRTGWFECSNADVNQLVSNALWSQRDNFVGIPTDCPQRDERMGWTGDIAVFSPTAAFNYDCLDFLDSWLQDLMLETEHHEGKTIPVVVPDVVKYSDHFWKQVGELALWGDAAAWVPTALWNAYGNKEALEREYPAFALHLNAVEKKLSPSGLWDTEMQLGDWLDPDAPADRPNEGKTDMYLIAQACLCRSARFAAEAAQALGKSEDVARWQALYEQSLAAFRKAYVLEGGRLTSDAPAAYALAIHFDLLEEADAPAAAARLAELVRENDYKVSTGFAGTPYVTWGLSKYGYIEDAYRLLLERECPSWMYPVTMGATTVWERWDSMLPNGRINPGDMTSFNHYALGGVCDWIYQVVGGIRPAKPGYVEVLVAPKPGTGIDWARCAHETPLGRVEVYWRVADGVFTLELSAPAGVPTTVELPDGTVRTVAGGTHRFGCVLSA